jgi:flagellar motor component MotA
MRDLIIIGTITVFAFIVLGYLIAAGGCTISPGIHPKLPIVSCK